MNEQLIMNQQLALFLEELQDLCAKYKANITACGCCDGCYITIDEKRVYTNLSTYPEIQGYEA